MSSSEPVRPPVTCPRRSLCSERCSFTGNGTGYASSPALDLGSCSRLKCKEEEEEDQAQEQQHCAEASRIPSSLVFIHLWLRI